MFPSLPVLLLPGDVKENKTSRMPSLHVVVQIILFIAVLAYMLVPSFPEHKPRPVKIVAFCGNEVDIVEDWLRYYGYIFGFVNLYVIDNLSTDGTYEILSRYAKESSLNVLREGDFRNKGAAIRRVIDTFDPSTIVIPVDMDEFIVVRYNSFGKELIHCEANVVRTYIDKLVTDEKRNYKMDYLLAIIDKKENTSSYDVRRASETIEFSASSQLGVFAKSLFVAKHFQHADTSASNAGNSLRGVFYQLAGDTARNIRRVYSDLYLTHFYSRGLDFFEKKVREEMRFFGYSNLTTDELEEFKRQTTPGSHKIDLFLAAKRGNLDTYWKELSITNMHTAPEPLPVCLHATN